MDLSALVPSLRVCFRKHPEILAVYAFGSVVKGKDRRSQEMDLSSDLDLGILLSFAVPLGRRWEWWKRLQGELDSLVRQEVDVVILNGASLGVVHEILRTGKRVYEKPGRKFRREEAQLLSEALDFLPIKETIEKKAIERIKAYRG
jgi:predicted nucleotidyltransferase